MSFVSSNANQFQFWGSFPIDSQSNKVPIFSTFKMGFGRMLSIESLPKKKENFINNSESSQKAAV
jgi:hypothetical protein